MSDVDNFLAHHGVKGMKWGVRRNKHEKSRLDVFKNKSLDQALDRLEKEKKVQKLLKEDLYPKRTAAKKYVESFLQEKAGTTISSALLGGATLAAGTAFMAMRINSSFSDVSLSAIRFK